MEVVARDQQQQLQQQVQEEEQAGPYPIEQLQVRLCFILREAPEWQAHTANCQATRPQELGVPAADIKKLKEGGINTVEALARATKRELCLIKGISEAKVAKLQQEGRHPAACLHRSCLTAGALLTT